MIRLCLENLENFVGLIFQNGFWVVKYHLFVRSNFNFLHNSQWINFSHPVVSSFILFFVLAYSITGASPSDCLMSYPGESLVGSHTTLQGCSRCILQSKPTGLPCIDASAQSPTLVILLLSILYTYGLTLSSLRYKALCTVINFLVRLTEFLPCLF